MQTCCTYNMYTTGLLLVRKGKTQYTPAQHCVFTVHISWQLVTHKSVEMPPYTQTHISAEREGSPDIFHALYRRSTAVSLRLLIHCRREEQSSVRSEYVGRVQRARNFAGRLVS